MRYSVTAAAGFVLLASTLPAAAQVGPPASANWAGPYVGLNVGGEWARIGDSATVPATGSTVNQSHHETTVTGGGQVGYNWQLNNWVLGVEGDVRGGGPSNSGTLAGPQSAGFAAGDNFKASSSWNASARGRVGYAFGPALAYATGGVAFADASMKANFVPVGALPGTSGSDSTNNRAGVRRRTMLVTCRCLWTSTTKWKGSRPRP